MQFNSISFLVFFPVVIFIFSIIPKKLRVFWLLVASYYFYMSWNVRYIFLIFSITVISYIGGLLLTYLSNRKTSLRKFVLVSCISLEVLGLVVFKYLNFAIDSFLSFIKLFNISIPSTSFDIILPVGISFFTFQSIGYIIDVYRGDIKEEKNFFKYALFVSFFPQLVAGPIERSKNLLSQIDDIKNFKTLDGERIISGSIFMIYGLFLKMVIADRASLVVDRVFDNYYMYGSTELIFAVIMFSLQIYCDFASYSLIAIGSSKIIGINLMENFASPYFSTSVKEFWNRWHISLSSWLRDYIYIPLGGNRKGNIRKYLNTIIVFLISGIWHGANWTFVLWGCVHGFYIVLEDIIKRPKQSIINKLNIKTDCFSWRFLLILKTYFLCSFAWIFFRADSISVAFDYIKRIIFKPNPWVLINDGLYSLGLNNSEMNIFLVSFLILFIVDYIRYHKDQTIDIFLISQNVWFRLLAIIALILIIITYGEYGPSFDAKQFIYFQF